MIENGNSAEREKSNGNLPIRLITSNPNKIQQAMASKSSETAIDIYHPQFDEERIKDEMSISQDMGVDYVVEISQRKFVESKKTLKK